jgi:hypothetical protein
MGQPGPRAKPSSADADGSSKITAFFKRPNKGGRPKKGQKRGRRRGRRSVVPSGSAEVTPVVEGKAAGGKAAGGKRVQPTWQGVKKGASRTDGKAAGGKTRAQPKKRASRTNWSTPENAAKLQEAVEEWHKKSTRCTPQTSLRSFAEMAGIPFGTVSNYVTGSSDKRRKLGASVGRTGLLKKNEETFVVEVLRRADRGNDGKSRREGLDVIQELRPDLNRRPKTSGTT